MAYFPESRKVTKQNRRKSFLLRCVLRSTISSCVPIILGLFISLAIGQRALAIPPNTPVNNTATVTYSVSGVDYSVSGSAGFTTDAGSGNSPPHAVAVAPATVPENADGVLIGTLTADDLDPADTHTFTVSDPRFEIVGDELRLVSGQSLDFETEASIALTITATDSSGGVYSQVVTIVVTDINEVPEDINLTDVTVVANVDGAIVGQLSSIDPDAGDSHTYVVDDPRFEVVGTTLKLRDDQQLPLGSTVTVIVTTTDSGGLQYSESFDISAVPPGGGTGINSSISIFQASPGNPGGLPTQVGQTQCDAGAGPVNMPAPTTVFGDQIPIPSSVELFPTALLKSNDAVFLVLSDPDANLDSAVVDTATVVITTDAGDSETIVLLETAVDSGSFAGFIQSVLGAPVINNCQLETGSGQTLTATYTDANDSLDTAVLGVLVDPFGVVFDSATGQPINGAVIRILDAQTGQLATVFDDDGVTAFPATLTTGDPAFGLADGHYRFPFVNTGQYVFQVIPPNRFSFPSVVADSDLQLLPGAPYILQPGSRGQPYDVPIGPAVRIDIPLDLQPVQPSDSQLELFSLLQNDPNAGAEYVAQSQCFNGTGFVSSGDALTLSTGAVNLPVNAALSPSGRFARGDAIFIKVTDTDQDLDPFAPDTIEVSVSVAGQPDQERIVLVETNDSTGVFTGFVQTTSQGNAAINNCVLEAPFNSTIEVNYVDSGDNQDTAQSDALLDPGFTVFSSVNGDLIDGTTVTLIDAATGLAATGAVFSSDGVTPFPATIETGTSVADAAGTTFDFSDGSFYFPVIVPGTYRLEVSPPVSFSFPSAVSDVDLNTLTTGPYVLQPGSRGADFTVTAGQPVSFDIPIDPTSADLFLTKQASKEVLAVGDFLQYQISIGNSVSSSPASGLQLIDDLPLGFRYVADSLQIVSQSTGAGATNPVVDPNGRRLTIALPVIPTGERIEVKYVAEVTAGARMGAARNTATVTGVSVNTANIAFADVLVREDLLRRKATIVGQVWEGSCEMEQTELVGRSGVRIWLENGTFAVTDDDGKYHFEDVDPGTHVVQMDTATLPLSHEAILCHDDTRAAGNPRSQFVDVQGGTLWRADFRITKKPSTLGEVVTRLDAEAVDDKVRYRLRLRSGDIALRDFKATIMLDDKLSYVEGSALLDGQPKADPSGISFGALTFRLPATAESTEYNLQFDAAVVKPEGVMVSKAIVQMSSAAGKHRSEVNTNELSVQWPSSLVRIAESNNKFKVQPNKKVSNEASLQQARQTNSAALTAGELIAQAKQSDAMVHPEAAPAETSESKVRAAAVVESVGVVGEVHEPSKGSNRSRSNVSRTSIQLETKEITQAPYVLPELDRSKSPVFDHSWLIANRTKPGIAWPPERFNPPMPAIRIAVVHSAQLRPQILVDGKLANPLTYEGSVRNHEYEVVVSIWDGVSISEHDTQLEVQLLDSQGDVTEKYQREVHYSGAPARAEMLLEQSYLVADGLYPPMLAVRFYDRAGYPLRSGTTGEFNVAAPYRALNKAKHLENSKSDFNNERYKVLGDGIAYIQLEPTTQTGEVEINFQFDQVRKDRVRARLAPGARDWIMVGLLEGSYAKNSLSGNLENLAAHGLDDDTVTDGRAAFYAKGMVKGDWLLTAAYDTDKAFERSLREQIDPNQFYTLYGDGSEQLYDAQSQRKLYLKLERSRFVALFGDYDTSFNQAELSRYERRLNGADLGYFGDRVTARAFVSETDQGFVRDEIRGDGTSGVYRLSNSRVVRGSETVRIVTRDRFSTEQVLEETSLGRYTDYTIDYDLGSLIFKQPVFSQDDGFNPIFIEVEYEIAQEAASDEVVAGGRLSYRLDDNDSEIAATYIDDGTRGRGGELVGADLTLELTKSQKITAEIAQTRSDLNGTGDAFLLQYEHSGEKLAGRAYVREQEGNFGLGQQSSLEVGTRKIGLEGEYRASERLLVTAQALRQEALAFSAERTILDAKAQYQLGKSQVTGGIRGVTEETQTGEQLDATQILLGASHSLLRNKLTLRVDAEIEAGSSDNTDFPSRGIIGADYEILNGIELLAEQELTWGSSRDTQDSRFGVRARPWTGADMNSIVSRERGESGERLFATTGLLQQWRLDEKWLFDVGLDRVQTIEESGTLQGADALLFNATLPPASGTFNEDFTAVFTGVGYTADAWNVTSRLEFHTGDQADKWNFLAGANHQLAEGKVISSSLSVLNEESVQGLTTTTHDTADLRFGLAWRPFQSPWTFLNRTDLVYSKRMDATFDTRTAKWVNNFNANYKQFDGPAQLSLQLGVKHVIDHIDSEEYSATTLLYGAQYRHDLGKRWDLGLHGQALHSLDSAVVDYSAGISVGHSLFNDMWVSVGYNFLGFEDEDFIAADYTAKGWFVKVRLKFDQEMAKRFLEYAGMGRSRKMQSSGNSR